MTTPLYTANKVYYRMAELLPDGFPAYLDAVRFSLEGDTAGVGAQRAAHLSIYTPRSLALQKLATWSEDAWDPTHQDAGARYGIHWLSLADLHHNASPKEAAPVVAVVLVDDVLLVNVTLSATKRHFHRPDGDDENAYLVLLLALMNHYASLREIRWADDVTRAAREDFGWAGIKRKCKDRNILMTLGGRSYDLKDPGAEMALKALGMTASGDDTDRRKKLTGKRLVKYMNGGAAIAEDQMPHGWRHRRDEHGRPVKEDARGLVPEGEPDTVRSLPQIYRAAAEGMRWTDIGTLLAKLEGDGTIARRSHSVVGRSYADTEGHGAASAEAAKSVLVRSNFRPPTAPAPEAIAQYEHGADPAEVFDADTRLFIAKIELVRTGRYFRRLTNDIRGRDVELNGVRAVYADERDEFGWFDVLSAPWPWPVDPQTGEPMPSFGIPDTICRKAAARILRELRDMPVADQGGRAHRRPRRRILQQIDNWFVEPGAVGARYPDEPTEYGIEARQNASGRENFIVLFRRATDGTALRGTGRRAWSWVGKGETRPQHIAATGSLIELTASVRTALDDAIRNLAEPTNLAAYDAVEDRDIVAGRRAALLARVDRITAQQKAALQEAANQRAMAARKLATGDLPGADAYDQLAVGKDEEAARAERDAASARDELAALDRACADEAVRNEHANVTAAAYLVAGLDRAVTHGGRGPTRLGLLADQRLRQWRFIVDGDDMTWAAVAALPLTGGGEMLLPLTGVIRNVRTKIGRMAASSEHVARLLLAEGRDLDELAIVLDCTRSNLLTQGVMPWLAKHDITARGAKNALADHPIPAVRRIVYAAAAGATSSVRWPAPVTDLLVATYTNRELAWADAACADDVEPVMQLAATLATRPGNDGIGVDEAALLLGLPYRTVRQWVRPYDRVSGFTRPRYFEFVPGTEDTRLRLIACPHRRCRGTAAHVVLLPEVAASGYGVLCTECRRAPNTDKPWAATSFPPAYLAYFTRHPEADGPLRATRQTVAITGPTAFDLAADAA